MRYLTSSAILAACTCMALVGCGATTASTSGSVAPGGSAAGTAQSASTVPAAGAADGSVSYPGSISFPIAVGNTWKYEMTFAAPGSHGTGTDKVVAVRQVATGRQVTMLSTTDLPSTATLIFIFHPDGSVTYPLAEVGGATTSSDGILWPPAAVIASGRPVQQRVTMHTTGTTGPQIVQTTVQGAGTVTVTVPAGTYQATIVKMTMTFPLGGSSVTVVERTWIADGVGPVKAQTTITQDGHTTMFSGSELTSFTKG